jgi:hypothetical protein
MKNNDKSDEKNGKNEKSLQKNTGKAVPVTDKEKAANLPTDKTITDLESLTEFGDKDMLEPENSQISGSNEQANDVELGLDKDGTQKLSINETLNIVAKSIVHIFEDRAKTSLPKITPTEVETMLAGYEGIKINWQFSDLKKTKGRLALVSILDAKDHVLLPTDINEEWEFGVDYELMAKEAAARGEKFGEEELALAKQEAELDEADRNRLSLKHLKNVADTIESIFAERELTCLPKLTDKDVRQVLRNQSKTIGVNVVFTNEQETAGYYELTEFLNKVRVPENGEFEFSIDNQRVLEKREAALNAERDAAQGK